MLFLLKVKDVNFWGHVIKHRRTEAELTLALSLAGIWSVVHGSVIRQKRNTPQRESPLCKHSKALYALVTH